VQSIPESQQAKIKSRGFGRCTVCISFIRTALEQEGERIEKE
jgi:hypothetical protein